MHLAAAWLLLLALLPGSAGAVLAGALGCPAAQGCDCGGEPPGAPQSWEPGCCCGCIAPAEPAAPPAREEQRGLPPAGLENLAVAAPAGAPAGPAPLAAVALLRPAAPGLPPRALNLRYCVLLC